MEAQATSLQAESSTIIVVQPSESSEVSWSDSAAQGATQGTTQGTTTQDNRPIWPGRPEVIYTNYLARKEAFLAANPTIRPSNYRRAIGLEVYDRAFCRQQAIYMPLDRLDLQTETWVKGRPNWSIEEIHAYIDCDNKLQKEVDKEEELIGPFSKRSRKEIIAEVRARCQEDTRKYRFYTE